MPASTITTPVTGAQVARALTYLAYAFVLVALLLRALSEWLTDRIAGMGYAG
jgi:hypothetical protein